MNSRLKQINHLETHEGRNFRRFYSSSLLRFDVVKFIICQTPWNVVPELGLLHAETQTFLLQIGPHQRYILKNCGMKSDQITYGVCILVLKEHIENGKKKKNTRPSSHFLLD